MGKNEILGILRDYKAQMGERYGITALGVFGSVARGELHDDSDVDVCVQTVTPDPFILVHIREDIEERVHRHVDLVRVRERMNPYLKERIEREGVYV